jgi:hypothetical protein
MGEKGKVYLQLLDLALKVIAVTVEIIHLFHLK